MIVSRLALPLALLVACTDTPGGDDDAAALPDGGPAPVAFSPPRNPHLADSTWPIFHRDSYGQHSSELAAVEGRGTVSSRQITLDGLPIFVLFDGNDDILAVSKRVSGGTLWKIRRDTLEPVAHVDISSNGTFSGAYGYLDAEGRAVMSTGTVIRRFLAGDDSFTVDAELDLADSLQQGELIIAITVLYSGEIAFIGDLGTLGVISAALDSPPADKIVYTGEEVANGIVTDDEGGIYLVTSAALRRIDWDATAGELTEIWSVPVGAPYAEPRPGRLGIGSGTTPALMMDDMVAITDDEESMNLIVVRRGRDVPEADRVVCKTQVFDGEATTDNAIVVAGRSMIIEQNLTGKRGVARFDVEPDGSCRRVWVADVHAPSCVPTLSTASSLAYVYTEHDGDWALTGLDLSTGREAFSASPGSGGTYNNFYAAVTIGPDNRVYIGTISGLLVFADE